MDFVNVKLTLVRFHFIFQQIHFNFVSGNLILAWFHLKPKEVNHGWFYFNSVDYGWISSRPIWSSSNLGPILDEFCLGYVSFGWIINQFPLYDCTLLGNSINTPLAAKCRRLYPLKTMDFNHRTWTNENEKYP